MKESDNMPRTRKVSPDAPPVPINEDSSKLQIAQKQLESGSKQVKRRLMNEPQVKVNGNPMFRPYLGKVYTYMFNDIEVTINFDGRDYYYPKSVAENLTKKLADIAIANTPVDISEKI